MSFLEFKEPLTVISFSFVQLKTRYVAIVQCVSGAKMYMGWRQLSAPGGDLMWTFGIVKG